jgi:RNA polymerase sporulation-specific sigma factor
MPMIIGEIRRYLRDSSTIKVSRSLKDIAYKALTAKEKLTNALGREPLPAEIAEEISVAPKDVVTALEAICDPVSLYDPIYNDGGDVILIMDQIKDKENKEEKWIFNISVSQAIDKLSPKERNILSMRFFQDKTQTEVASEIGISQAQVSRLEKSALISMRKHM